MNDSNGGKRLLAAAMLALVLTLAAAAVATGHDKHGPRHGHGLGHGHHHHHPSWPPPHDGPDPLSPQALIGTIRQYASLPDHLTGTDRSAAAQKQVAGQFARNGLKLGSVSYAFRQFHPTRVSLSTDSGKVAEAAIAPLLYSGVTPRSGITGELFAAADGSFDPNEVGGKIVVSSGVAGANLGSTIEAAQEGGARALVFVTKAVGDLPQKQNSNARVGTGDFPVLLVGKLTGAAVVADAEAGESARLVLNAETGIACDRDVWGVLPGADPSRRVFIGTPTSSLVPSASERGGGVAILLGLADHYSQLPRSQRPETLVFLATTGHETGFLGLEALIDATGEWYTGADAYVHFGASLGAAKAVENPDGSITVTPGVQQPGGSLRPSENPLLQSLTPAAFAAAGAPLAEVEPHISGAGEQMWAYGEGIPTLSFNGGSLYFHTAGDLPSVVDPELLAREADGFRRAIDSITALAPGALRAANGEADAYGAAIDPRDSSPENLVFGAAGVGGPAPTIVPSCAQYR
jgi:hypothetical protein